jgi:formylglycine-generating enzyme required for sulfatase activity
MKKIIGFLIKQTVIVWMCFILISGCEKDMGNKEEDKDETSTEITTVQIPAGTFTMGSPASDMYRTENEAQFGVTISAFRMSKYEITNAQFAAFLNAKNILSNGIYSTGAYPTQALIYTSGGDADFGLHYIGSKWVPAPGFENSPVINVTWYGAAEFAKYAGGSLPTEAQWEYACRAGTTSLFNTGNCLTNDQANYDWRLPTGTCTNTNTSSPGKTMPVGSYPANAFGLYDMHGNVLEWVADWSGIYPTTAQTNPTGPATGTQHVARGGSWVNPAKYCRSANHFKGDPSVTLTSLGFRIVFVP